MDNELEVIRDQMEDTRSSLADKLDALEDKVMQPVENAAEVVNDTIEAVKGTVADVREFLDIRHHVERRPWLMMGGAVVTGCIGGRMLGLGRKSEPIAEAPKTNGFHAPASTNGAEKQNHSATSETPGGGAPSTTNGNSLHNLFEGLQGLAIGTMMGVIKDLVLKAVPTNMAEDAARAIDDLTHKLGGKPLQRDNSDAA